MFNPPGINYDDHDPDDDIPFDPSDIPEEFFGEYIDEDDFEEDWDDEDDSEE